MKEMWNSRYSVDEYVYGKEPNNFFREQLSLLKPGKCLLPGEGEGRNAVYAAGKGWHTEAFDYSEEAKYKALRLASEKNVLIDYTVSSWGNHDIRLKHYDLIAVFYLHLQSEEKALFHKKVMQWLRPGGIFLAEYFSKEQLNMSSGGPKNPALLYHIDDLKNDFAENEIVIADEKLIELNEGEFHQGNAWVNRLKVLKTNDW